MSENKENESENIELNPDILQEMIDESKNIGTTPFTIFLKDIPHNDLHYKNLI